MDQTLKKKFFQYVSRNVLGMMALSFYILADTFFIAQALGANGLTALNLSIALFSFMLSLGLMLGIGGGSRFAILEAQNKKDQADRVFASMVKFGLLISLVIGLIGFFGAGTLAGFLGADKDTFAYTKTYLATILTASPLFILNHIFVAFVRNDQDPGLSMMAMLTGSLSNIVLDYLFMFPLKMGMFGAAFATTLSPLISLAILSRHFGPGKKSLAFLRHKMDLGLVFDGMRLGLSALIIELSSGVVLLSFNFVLLSLAKNIGVAAYGIVANIALVAISLFTGIGQGIQPLVSRYYGREEYREMRATLGLAVKLALLLSLVIYVLAYAYTDPIVSLFNKEGLAQIQTIAREGIRIYFLGFFFAGINICLSMYLSASENGRAAFIVSLARGLVVILPCLLISAKIWGVRGVWISFVLTEIMVSLIGLYLIRVLEKRK